MTSLRDGMGSGWDRKFFRRRRAPKMDVFWEVPSDFRVPKLAKLGLAEMVLLTPFKEHVVLEGPVDKPSSYSSMNVGVAFF